ncbi:MAG: cytochrome c biogenesis protein CcsA [Coriobacteriia bacterium]|nr:cytochrome c biogenesis protein CcsA [Coriobacteriia bacterium]
MASFGSLLLIAAFIFSILASLAFGVSTVLHIQSQSKTMSIKKLRNLGTPFIILLVFSLSLAVILIEFAFFSNDFSLLYVAQHYPKDVIEHRWIFLLSGVWGGRQGSLLFWVWLISLFSLFSVIAHKKESAALKEAALFIMSLVMALFIGTLIFSTSNNPFVATPAEYLSPTGKLIGPAQAWGMNRLLEHWAMVLHPPALFIGYAGITVPFAYALGALIIGDVSQRWIVHSQRITLFAWTFLSIGIILGALWAYVVLGWGGFWGWDAVENASLLSWLTLTALLHAMTTAGIRNRFKIWTYVLAAASFIFVVLASFITRSGLVQSVHAFAEDQVSTRVFTIMIALSFISTLVLLIVRRKSLAEPDDLESLFSKNASYYLTFVLLLASAVLLAYLTLAPSLPRPLPLAGSVISIETYEMAARPVGIFLLLLAALCPSLAWSKTDGKKFWTYFKLPCIVGIVLFVGLLVYQYIGLYPNYASRIAALDVFEAPSFARQIFDHIMGSLALLVASMLIMNSLYVIVRDVSTRAQASKSSTPQALHQYYKRMPGRLSGFFAHFAMGIILIALVGSAIYPDDQIVTMEDKQGSTAVVGDYTVRLEERKLNYLENGDTQLETILQLEKDGRNLGELRPSMNIPQGMAGIQQLLHADTVVLAQEDFFIALQGYSASNDLVYNIKVNPFINLLWIGSAFLVLSGILAFATPRRLREESTVES